jgi:hypothetical protein
MLMLATLQQLQPLHNFCKLHAQAREALFSPKEFWAPGRAWLRDAYCAEAFAKKTYASKVGLIAETRPDFSVQYRNAKVLRFEVTLADRPGRQMAREERQNWDSGDQVRQDPENNWRARRLAIPDALRSASERKARKAYGPETNLLIYLNLGTYDYWRDEIERELILHTEPARNHFNSIWVLWSGRLYRTWPQPFLGSPGAFRPGRHELGQAISAYDSQRRFRELFTKGRYAA